MISGRKQVLVAVINCPKASMERRSAQRRLSGSREMISFRIRSWAGRRAGQWRMAFKGLGFFVPRRAEGVGVFIVSGGVGVEVTFG